MKILIINSFYYPMMPGGAEHSVKNLAESLTKKGHDVNVLCIGKQGKVEVINEVNVYRINNCNIYNAIDYHDGQINKLGKLAYRALDFHGFLNKSLLEQKLKEINPDIVHVNNIPGFGLSLFSVLNKNHFKTIFTGRDYYLLCPKLTLMTKENKSCLHKKRPCRLYEQNSKYFLNLVDCVTAPSEFTLGHFQQLLKDSSVKFKCIHNSIDVDEQYLEQIFNQKYHQEKQTLDLVYLGKLAEHKGIKLMLEQFNLLNDKTVKLHIAGDGPLMEEVRAQVNENIIYHGKLDKRGLDNLLSNMDVLLAPSLWNEPFGRIVIDAYKYCMPIITTGNGGLKELVISEKTGFIIDFYQYNQFKDSIEFYKNKDNLKLQMEHCKNEVVKYSNDNIINQYEALYTEILSK